MLSFASPTDFLSNHKSCFGSFYSLTSATRMEGVSKRLTHHKCGVSYWTWSTHHKSGELPDGRNKGHITCWTVSCITILPVRSVFYSNMLTFVRYSWYFFITDLSHSHSWQSSEMAVDGKKISLTLLLTLHSSFQYKHMTLPLSNTR